jgi:hypothetical protein
MAVTKSRRTAAPDIFSGHNPNVPIRMYDTHPNKRFYLGDLVMSLDPERPPLGGVCIGHVAEDRITVQWGDGRLITQEDVEEVIPIREQAGKQDADKNITSFDSPWLPENQRKTELDKLKQKIDELTEQLEKKQDKEEDKEKEKEEGGEDKGGEGDKKASRRRRTVSARQTLTYDKKLRIQRHQALISLSRVAGYLRKNGLENAAAMIRKASAVAAAMDELYSNPRTRTASADDVAMKAMSGAISIALRVAKHLRNQDHKRAKKLGELVEISMASALTYPRTPSRVRQAATKEEIEAYNAAEMKRKKRAPNISQEMQKAETAPTGTPAGGVDLNVRDAKALAAWMGKINNPTLQQTISIATRALRGQPLKSVSLAPQQVAAAAQELRTWSMKVRDPEFKRLLIRGYNAILRGMGQPVANCRR